MLPMGRGHRKEVLMEKLLLSQTKAAGNGKLPAADTIAKLLRPSKKRRPLQPYFTRTGTAHPPGMQTECCPAQSGPECGRCFLPA
jgi:hypothetical protein